MWTLQARTRLANPKPSRFPRSADIWSAPQLAADNLALTSRALLPTILELRAYAFVINKSLPFVSLPHSPLCSSGSMNAPTAWESDGPSGKDAETMKEAWTTHASSEVTGSSDRRQRC